MEDYFVDFVPAAIHNNHHSMFVSAPNFPMYWNKEAIECFKTRKSYRITCTYLRQGRIWGGGGAYVPYPQGFDPLPTQRVPPLVLFNAFFGLFFQKFACGAQILAKIGIKQCFKRTRKINLVDLKNKKKFRQNFRSFFGNPPPLEKIIDPPLI